MSEDDPTPSERYELDSRRRQKERQERYAQSVSDEAAPVVPDYSGESAQESSVEVMKRLRGLVLRMAQLELEEHDLEDRLKSVQKELRSYRENLVPEVMAEIGSDLMRTEGGITVEIKEELRAAFPKDSAKQAQAFAWLKETGNDGLIKREITVQYGRDSVQWAEELTQKLEEWGVGEHATVAQEWNIHHQTLLAFLRGELKDGHNVPMELFGAFTARYARIKRSK